MRIKFAVKKLGIAEFIRIVEEERKNLRPDPRWTAFLFRFAPHRRDAHAAEAVRAPPAEATSFERGAKHNVRPR